MLQNSSEEIYFKKLCLLAYIICVNIIEHGVFRTIESMVVLGMCFLFHLPKGDVIKMVLEQLS